MFHRLFVPLDGSLCAEKAIPVAATLARASAGTVILARVLVPPLTEEYAPDSTANEARLIAERERISARAYLDEVMERYDQVLAGLHVIVEVIPGTGTIPSTLLLLAEQEHTDLIVMCSRGESWLKRWILGSVTQRTMRQSPQPVLALNEHGDSSMLANASHPLRVLVPLDGSPFSEAVLPPLLQFLAMLPTKEPPKLHLLRIVSPPLVFGGYGGDIYATDTLEQDQLHEAEQYLQKLTRLISPGGPGNVQVVVTTQAMVHASVAETILQYTRSAAQQAGPQPGYDLIALATHGRSGLKRALLGSVTEHIFGATTLPLFVVHPAAVEVAVETTDGETKKTPETKTSLHWVGLF